MSGTESSSPTRQSYQIRRFPSDIFPAIFVAESQPGKRRRDVPDEACFFNEARAANLVQHPAIVRVFDYGTTTTGTAYLAMEFLEGESLRTRLHRLRTLSEVETIRIGRQIASGLATAHQSQVVHRDLKPDKITPVEKALKNPLPRERSLGNDRAGSYRPFHAETVP